MKIAVVGGAGRVGATTLFQLVLEGVADELAVVDVVTDRAQGEMLDLLHGTHLSHRVTFSGPGYEACDGADFVIITAGIPRRPEETRLDLLKKNVDNLRDNVLPTLSMHAGNAFIIMVANPADVLTYQAAIHGAFPAREPEIRQDQIARIPRLDCDGYAIRLILGNSGLSLAGR